MPEASGMLRTFRPISCWDVVPPVSVQPQLDHHIVNTPHIADTA